jgi:hypothetical protein
LIAEKVRIPPKRRGGTTFHPQCAAQEDVQKYDDDQIGGPNKAEILIAWHQPLSSASPWNWDAITLLAEKVQQLLMASMTKYDKSWLELSELMKQIIACLRETKISMNLSSPRPAASGVKQRRRARKRAVSQIIS